MKQLFRTLTLLALPLVVAACNTDYNFDNISLEVTVGDAEGIAIPLGETGEITLASLLEESGLETDDNGTYGFSFSDSMSYTASLGTIDPITGIAPTIDPVSASFIGNINANIPTFSASKELAFPSGVTGGMDIPAGFPLLGQDFNMHYDPHTFEGNFQVEVPEQIASVKTIYFGANGEGSTIDLQFDLGGIAGVSDKRLIEKFNIELPAGFTLDKVAGEPINDYVTIYPGEGSSTPNHFHIENYNMTGNHLSVAICVKSVDLSSHTISQEGMLTISENVTYDLDFTGSFKAGRVEATSPKVTVEANLSLYEATFVTNNVSYSFEYSSPLTKSIEVPEEIKAIYGISILDDTTGNAPQLSLAMDIENAPVDMLGLRNVEITLPSYIQLATGQSGWSYQNGKLTGDFPEINTSGTIDLGTFEIVGIGELDIQQGVIDLSGEIGIKADIALPEGKEVTLRVTHEDMVIAPKIELPDLRVESISGLIDPDFGDLVEPVEVELGDFTASLEGIEMDLNIASPILNVSVLNPIGVGIDAIVKIDAYKEGAVAKSVSTPIMTIAPAEGGQPTRSDLCIVGDPTVLPAGVSYYLVDGLTDLIGLLPDKLVMTLSAETNKSQPHTITLQDSYTFEVDYSVEAPLAFSPMENGHISYTTTIEDVDLSSLKDVAVVIESLSVNIASESTLPIDLTMSVELLDESGAPIECVTSSTVGKIEGTTETTPKQSECSLTLNIQTPEGVSPFAEISRTKQVRCLLEGTTLAGGSLRPDQKIAAKLSLMLDKGITIDLGTIVPEENKPEPNEP
ncbi:MAG: hypothetical protein J6R10_02280 [Tidjanibacter sp.]|nr:hypothetical protein [Tidjanibacter sp.]